MTTSQKVSAQLPELARLIDAQLEGVAGQRIEFSLFVWTEGRASYISKSDRAVVAPVIQAILDGWRKNMPELPAHHIRDDDAADLILFKERMLYRMTQASQQKGRNSWRDQTSAFLSQLLHAAVARGDAVETACLCMMLSERGDAIES